MAKRQRKTSTGYPSIFSGKDRTRTRPAAMTKEGYEAFDEAKVRIARLVGRPESTTSVSDSDTIELLARHFTGGMKAVIAYLKQTLQFKG